MEAHLSAARSVKALEEAVTIIFQNNFDAESKICLTTLLRLLDNVLQQPSNDKVRKIRLANANFHAKVGSRRGGIDFLLACGFVRQAAPPSLLSASDEGEALLVLDQEDQNHLILARRLLETRLVRDLGVKPDQLPAYRPPPPPVAVSDTSTSTSTFNPYAGHRFDAQSAAVGTNLGPDAHYVSKTETELQKLAAKKSKLEAKLPSKVNREWIASHPGETPPVRTVEPRAASQASAKSDSSLLAAHAKKQMEDRQRRENGGFTTKAMRDLESLKKAKVYSHTLLTIQFADGCRLTGKFLPRERIRVVEAAIQECLTTDTDFELYITPPRQVLASNVTLEAQGLVPAAKVFVSWKPGPPASSYPGSYIQSDLFATLAVATFPSAQALADGKASAEQEEDKKPEAKKKDPKASREDNLLRRMMGGSGGLGAGRGGASGGGSGESKKPKWFKG